MQALTGSMAEGSSGPDRLTMGEGYRVRRFPINQATDRHAKTTGGETPICESFRAKEATRTLSPTRVLTSSEW